jgi:hypothetical protein
MKLPRTIAGFVVLLLVFTAAQVVFWKSRPPLDWHPAWWQSELWAQLGILAMMPLLSAVSLFEIVGVKSIYILRVAFVVGFIGYAVAVYIAVVWIVKQFTYKPPA